MADNFLSVVDADDTVIRRELRSVIHKTGLRHREVHVWFVTRDRELIFQRRGPNKDTWPNMLDATAGGHVEEGQDYLNAALAEAAEETGVKLTAADLVPLAKIDVTQVDKGSATHNVVYRMIYMYPFDGTAADLQVEDADGAGFETVALADVLAERGDSIEEMLPGLFNEGYAPAWQAMRDALKI